MKFPRFLLAASLLLGAAHSAAATGQSMLVLKSSGCGCCLAWIEHLERAGFSVEARDLPMGTLMKEKLDAGLKPGLTSCHTGKVSGYIVEGHVPALEIKRMLAERPDAIGLSVPNMPAGSPGMEYGGKTEPYEVLLVLRDGTSKVYADYP